MNWFQKLNNNIPSGIGIDIVKIDRFRKKPFLKNKSFYEKIFLKDEINYCLKFNDPYPHFAGKFAIKESTIKAIPTKIPLNEILIFYKDAKPMIKLNSLKLKNYSFLVSVSHENEYAIAIVYSSTFES